jgi:predicted TIM-barrel fold metal-dependent hydrolase
MKTTSHDRRHTWPLFLTAIFTISLVSVAACRAPHRRDAVQTPGSDANARERAAAAIVPLIDYHRHLRSPAAAEREAQTPLPTVELPQDLARLLIDRTERWNNAAGLAQLYTEHSTLLDPTGPRWLRGRLDVSARMASFFRAAYRVTPIAWSVHGSAGHIAGYYTRGDGAASQYLGHVLLSLEQDAAGAWRIAAETPTFGSLTPPPITAEQLVAQFDAAGIRKGVVLSLAYWFGSPHGKPVENEYAVVRAENDWTAAEAARFPDRLVAFCSFNPLKEYALEELERCAKHPHLKGLKLHFANSGVDVKNPAHVERLRSVFRAANTHKLPIVVHVWVTDTTYGREHSQIFLDRVLSEAPDVVVQIAHFAGGGSGYSDDAFAVFAEAIAANDRRTRNLYFDVTAVIEGPRPADEARRLAARMREVGLERILFGSDMAPPPAWDMWMLFRMNMPLTEAEFRTIANNVAPYMR